MSQQKREKFLGKLGKLLGKLNGDKIFPCSRIECQGGNHCHSCKAYWLISEARSLLGQASNHLVGRGE